MLAVDPSEARSVGQPAARLSAQHGYLPGVKWRGHCVRDAQGLEWAGACRAQCGVGAGEEADDGADQRGGQGVEGVQHGGPVLGGGEGHHDPDADAGADQPAEGAQRHGFGEELRGDVPGPGTDRAAHADLAGALQYRDECGVAYPYRPDEQADQCEDEEQAGEVAVHLAL